MLFSSMGIPRPRLLCLHSFRTSGLIFKQQVARGKWDVLLSDIADLVYVDAPHLATGPIPEDVKPFFKPPYYEWMNAVRLEDGKYDFKGLDESTQYVTDVLQQQGPFDGIIGFSQGAALTAALVALQERGMALQDVPRLKLCIIIAGFPSRLAMHRGAFAGGPLKTPSLHVMGEADELTPLSKRLADMFEKPVVIVHPRGHVVPQLEQEQEELLRSFVLSTTGNSSL